MVGTPTAGRGWGCVTVISEHKYWQPCMFKLKVHTYQVIQSIKQLIFLGNYSTMSRRGCRGRPRRVISAVFECPVVIERDEHVVGSTAASMNQPQQQVRLDHLGHQKELKCKDCLRQSKWHRLHR